MGRQATLQESTRTSSLQRENTPTSTTAVEGEGESEPEEEFKINTEWSASPTSELIAAHIDTAKAREVSSTPLKFHGQIRALWEYDKMIQRSDVDVKQFRYQILPPPSI